MWSVSVDYFYTRVDETTTLSFVSHPVKFQKSSLMYAIASFTIQLKPQWFVSFMRPQLSRHRPSEAEWTHRTDKTQPLHEICYNKECGIVHSACERKTVTMYKVN